MYVKKANERLIQIISKMTSIPISIIKKYGVDFIFNTPGAVKGMTEERKKRIVMLQDFVSIWNEVEFLKEEILLGESSQTGQFFINRIGHKKDKEYFEVAFLSSSNKIIEIETLTGSISNCAVPVREIIKSALAYNAKSLMLSHSHPGGSLKATYADISVTKTIVDAAKLFDITVLDHIIATENNYFSFRENSLM